jgi:hypothetical protein
MGYFDSTIIVRSLGASSPAGTIVGTTLYALGTPVVVNPSVDLLGITAIDTTVSQTVRLSAQFNNAGNGVRLDVLTVEILSSGDVG